MRSLVHAREVRASRPQSEPGCACSRARVVYDGRMAEPAAFRVCSICRKPIGFGKVYYVCSVSTCNRTRTALFFCSVGCWSDHLPTARHRDAWAEERVAPKS